jgi:hypothetical protein
MTKDLNDDNEMSEQKCIFSEVEDIKSSIEDLTDRFERIAYQIEDIKKPLDLEVRAARAIEVLDKFDNYMRNLEKCNIMVNELKGQVAIVRATMNKTEKYQQSMHEKYKKAMKILSQGMRDTDNNE